MGGGAAAAAAVAATREVAGEAADTAAALIAHPRKLQVMGSGRGCSVTRRHRPLGQVTSCAKPTRLPTTPTWKPYKSLA